MEKLNRYQIYHHLEDVPGQEFALVDQNVGTIAIGSLNEITAFLDERNGRKKKVI